MLVARNNQTHFLNALKLITVPGGKAAEAAFEQLEWLQDFDASSEEDTAEEAGYCLDSQGDPL